MASSLGTGILLQSCQSEKKETPNQPEKSFSYDRTPAELKREQDLMRETFFDEHEMKTLTILVDYIIPKDEISGSASEAGVPGFIEFIVKDIPAHQLPLRGGLKWLDVQCLKRYQHAFAFCNVNQQIEMIEDIAFPEDAGPGMQQGVQFFNRLRNLTACGFFTSKMGIQDLGYVGNRPNQWDGVPKEVLDQYNLQYDKRTLDICVKFTT
ncbi:MAG: gluconate 2-dehydrogenase subunit 3 family protein [Bacteroidota bacterium]